jgi:hypothetical protein
MHLLIGWRPRHFSGEMNEFTRPAGLIYNNRSAVKVWLSLFPHVFCNFFNLASPARPCFKTSSSCPYPLEAFSLLSITLHTSYSTTIIFIYTLQDV